MSAPASHTSRHGPLLPLFQSIGRHPRLFAMLSIVYFLLVALNHEVFGAFIAETFYINDRQTFNRLFFRAGLAGAALYLLAVLPYYLKQKNYRALLYLCLTLLFTAGTVQWLVVVFSELIHFPQYSLLAILLFPVSRSYLLTFILCGFLGAIDEGVQYWYLSPATTDYFDFNDVVLNMLGSALGLLALGAWTGKTLPSSGIGLRQNGLIVLALLSLLAIAWATNLLDFIPPENTQNPATWTLVRHPASGFWADLPLGRRFHILRPLPGLLLLLGLTVLYAPLDKVLR